MQGTTLDFLKGNKIFIKILRLKLMENGPYCRIIDVKKKKIPLIVFKEESIISESQSF